MVKKDPREVYITALDKYYDGVKRGTKSGEGRPNYKEYSLQELMKCATLFKLSIDKV
jgi:hypothetical protein